MAEGTTGPARSYYRITVAGGETLRQTTADWATFSGGVGAILREVSTR